MSNQIAHNYKGHEIIDVQTGGLDFIPGLQFLCVRENSVYQHSVLVRTGLQQTYLLTNSGLGVCVREGCCQLF